ncbi:MAG: TrbI/VirB10 family protein [Iphinoe sp. HA4291-MV1]|jgi:hypothetical protein|nr:TrbI/VirB10 family protein [Iphinoe sp. HA4291-MV1]
MLQLQNDNQDRVNDNGNLQQANSVDALLPLDEKLVKNPESEDKLESEEGEEEENPAAVQTKHDFVTSPWSRLGIIGGAFGVGFLVMFVALNGMMNSGSNTAQTPVALSSPTPTSTPFQEKDGDVYAKLALQKQQQELETLNGKEEETKENNTEQETPNKEKQASATTNINTNKTASQIRVTPQQTPPPPNRRVYQEPNSEGEYRLRRSAVLASRPIEPKSPTATFPRITLPTSKNNTASVRTALSASRGSMLGTPKDPLAELERLRNLGSVGRVEYTSADNTTVASKVSEEEVPNGDETPRRRRNRRSETSVENTINSTPNNTGEVEELRPRWKPTNNTVELTASYSKQTQLASLNYLTDEAQILEERQTQYLVVGSSASATLVTPLILAQGSANNNLRFVARLDEPMKSNTGGIAIPAGTQVAVAMTGVDSGFNITASVSAILKDGTEYPISPGAISILGKGNNPLIARPYKNKGGEIALSDATVGTIAGLAKLGEIINQPQEEITEDLPFGGSRTRSRGNNRNIMGAFLEGAFGKVAETMGSRTQQASSEITSRPHTWYVPANTKISIRVNRSIKL